MYPINGGKLINIAAFISQPEGEGKVFPASHGSRRTKEEMLDAFSGWEPEAIQLLSVRDRVDFLLAILTCWCIRRLSKILLVGRFKIFIH